MPGLLMATVRLRGAVFTYESWRRSGETGCSGQAPMLATVTITAPARSAQPSGRLNHRPRVAFFSIAITAPKASIQPTLPVPTTNISSMTAQQHPTQNMP